VRAQALISLGRLNDASAAKSILPLTARPRGSVMPSKRPVHAQPDPDRVIPHLAVRALVSLGATDACLEALDGPHAQGALWALRYMHDKRAVGGLIGRLGTVRSAELRRDILATLVRLYHREADYKGLWWGCTLRLNLCSSNQFEQATEEDPDFPRQPAPTASAPNYFA
jgi:hypothetical protein